MDFEWRLNGECALWFLVSGDSTIIKDGSSGGATMVAGHPLGAAPLSYIRRRRWPSPKLLILSFSHVLWLTSSSLCFLVLYTSICLGEALLIFLHHHHHHGVVLLEFPRIRYFRCPTGARDGGRHRAVRVTEYGSAAFCNALLHDLEIGKWSSTSPTRIVLANAFGLQGWVLPKPLQVIS